MNPIFTNTAATDKGILSKYLRLPQPDDKVMATYIWIDGTGENLRGNKSLHFIMTFVFHYLYLYLS